MALRLKSAIAALIALAPISAHAAGRAEICYTAWSLSSMPATASTLFNCPTAGSHTIGELAGAGWIVRKMAPVTRSTNAGFEFATQLLIREEWIYRSGFEA